MLDTEIHGIFADEFCDEHTCYAVMRGGSNYGAGLGQRYYFKRPADTREHNTLLMMSESMDRSASFGFRCVVDAVARNDTTCEWQACGATDTLAQDSLIDLSAAGAWTHFGLGDASDVRPPPHTHTTHTPSPSSIRAVRNVVGEERTSVFLAERIREALDPPGALSAALTVRAAHSQVNTKRTADRLQLTLLRENVQPEQYSPAQPAARFSW